MILVGVFSRSNLMTRLLEQLGIPSGALVLDIGFGKPSELEKLARLVGDQGFVYGIEPSPSLVKVAIEQLSRMHNVKVLAGGAESIPLPDGSVNIILLKGVLHDVDDVSRAMNEAHRVLRHAGNLMIMDLGRFPLRWLRWSNVKWRLRRPSRILSHPPDKRPGFSREELSRFFEGAGFSLSRWEDNVASGGFSGHGVPLFLAVARKISKGGNRINNSGRPQLQGSTNA